ncbi:HAD hydrolase family protein [Paenibacillus apiarius]|uniref:HAD hydrolase family protein n=1 Tax=Paenibacillus apiarius TaxID=46240 RepID=UPI002342FBFD|nr:HAD hydrolase family protein [Paenibacillus apiarius]
MKYRLNRPSPKRRSCWRNCKNFRSNQYRSGEYIVFGNDENDKSMFTYAHRSVCVGGHSELSRLAIDRVVSDDQRGAHKILELLNE